MSYCLVVSFNHLNLLFLYSTQYEVSVFSQPWLSDNYYKPQPGTPDGPGGNTHNFI